MGNPEQDARRLIDQLLVQAGWHVCDGGHANITAYRAAIREFPLPGQGYVDNLLYINSRAAGVTEAKKASSALSGVEIHSAKCTRGHFEGLPRWRSPQRVLQEDEGAQRLRHQALRPTKRHLDIKSRVSRTTL